MPQEKIITESMSLADVLLVLGKENSFAAIQYLIEQIKNATDFKIALGIIDQLEIIGGMIQELHTELGVTEAITVDNLKEMESEFNIVDAYVAGFRAAQQLLGLVT